jgi:preprotein translocase subunit SecD
MSRIDQILRTRAGDVAASVTVPAAGTGTGTAAAPSLGGLFASGDSVGRDSTRRDSAAVAAGTDTAGRDTSSLLSGSRTGSFSRLVRQGGMPGQYVVAMSDVPTVTRMLEIPEVRAAIPPGKELLWGADTMSVGQQPFRALYVLDERPILTGEYVVSARENLDPMEGALVQFTLNNEGGRRFRQETGRHLKDYLATVLDERVMSNPAVIQSAIGTRGQITMGGRDISAAKDFSTVLNAGKLPVPLKVVEVRNIGPSLGQDSINKGMIAGAIAVLLVIVVMVTYYRFSGLLAVGALALYVLYTLAALAGFDAVLTLPGLAGFVLTIGIAVDANVLVFERIREELDRGHTVRTSIDEGFRHALPAIVDTSISTILTAAVLYQFGSQSVRGFAVTLIAGICASIFTALFVTKTFYLVWLQRSRATPQTLSI